MNNFFKRLLFLLALIVFAALFLPAGPVGFIWQGSLIEQVVLIVAYLLIGILALRTLASLGDSDADE